MSRNIESATQTAAAAETIQPVLFAKLEFDGGDVLAHTQLGNIAFGGDTYIGIGSFGGISPAQETSDLSNTPLSITLSNIPSTMSAILLGEHYQGRRATIYLGYLDLTTRALVADPTILYRGRINTADIQQDTSFTVTITIENRFAAWDKPLIRRYNNADQQNLYPGDRGFEFIEKVAQKPISWGGPG